MVSPRRSAQMGLAAAGLVLASSLGVLFAFTPRHEPVVVATPTDDTAPHFRLKDLDGQTYDSSRFRGKAVVVFFSSMLCSTCDAYQARAMNLAHQYAGDGRVQFLAMNQDLSEGDQTRLLEVRVFAKVIDRPFPTLLDAGAKATARFGAKPAQFAILDPRGVVRYLGSFDDSRDATKVKRQYVAEELAQILDEMPTAIAAR